MRLWVAVEVKNFQNFGSPILPSTCDNGGGYRQVLIPTITRTLDLFVLCSPMLGGYVMALLSEVQQLLGHFYL